MKKAVYYARVSTSAQEKERTIESQITELNQQIKKDGNVLVGEYVDNGWSGGRLDRPAMDRLRNDLKTDLFDVVYFNDADRIARKSTYQDIIISELLKYRKKIIIKGKDYVDNPENKFSLTVLGAVSEFEKAKIAERSMRGRREKAKQGAIVDSGGLFGYEHIKRSEKQSGRYELNIEQADTVRYIFETYARTDATINGLIKLLESRNIKTATGKSYWKSSVIRAILTNASYFGEHYFNRTERVESKKGTNRLAKTTKTAVRVRERCEWITVPVPPIIDRDLFDAVQGKLKRNAKIKRSPESRYFLSGLIKCGVCSHTYAGATWKRVQYYRCNFRDKLFQHSNLEELAGCDNKAIKGETIDSKVADAVIKAVMQPSVLKEHVEILQSAKREKIDSLSDELKKTSLVIGLFQAKKKRILDLYSEGDLDRQGYVEKIRELESRINDLRQEEIRSGQRLALLEKRKEIRAGIDYFCRVAKKNIKKLDGEQRARFVRNLLDEVIIYKNASQNKLIIRGLMPVGANRVDTPLPTHYTCEP